MRLTINHTTRYSYEEPVHYGLQQLRLTPKSRPGHQVLRWETSVSGGRKEASFDDQHNNHVELVSFAAGGTDFEIRSEGEVETSNTNGVVGAHGGYVPLWCFERATSLTRSGPGIRAMAKSLEKDGEDPIAQMHELSNKIADMVSYEIGKTHAATTAEEALSAGHGVCQDHAHIFVAAARHLHYPARYVSGYLMMNDRVDQDASHAWAEAHIDGIGWVGFDVSNRISPDERYVRVATGLDYRDAAPISGMRFGESREELLVTLQVQQ